MSERAGTIDSANASDSLLNICRANSSRALIGSGVSPYLARSKYSRRVTPPCNLEHCCSMSACLILSLS
eukprot:7958711-Pyramimonas_sp.AAC.1